MFRLKHVYSISLLVSILVFFNVAVYADTSVVGDAYAKSAEHGQGKGKGHGKGGSAVKAKKIGINKQKNRTKHVKNIGKSNRIRFADKDRAAITKYFSATPFPVTTLPPGIAKNLLRGKPLPPGIAKVFLPSDLVTQLPVYPGYEYLAVGRDVILMDSATGVVADILANVLR